MQLNSSSQSVAFSWKTQVHPRKGKSGHLENWLSQQREYEEVRGSSKLMLLLLHLPVPTFLRNIPSNRENTELVAAALNAPIPQQIFHSCFRSKNASPSICGREGLWAWDGRERSSHWKIQY